MLQCFPLFSAFFSLRNPIRGRYVSNNCLSDIMNYRHFYTSEKTKNNNNYQKLSNASSNQKKKKTNLSRSMPGISGAIRAINPILYIWSDIDSGPFMPLFTHPALFVVYLFQKIKTKNYSICKQNNNFLSQLINIYRFILILSSHLEAVTKREKINRGGRRGRRRRRSGVVCGEGRGRGGRLSGHTAEFGGSEGIETELSWSERRCEEE